MADIELVIKIPEEVYKRIQSLSTVDYFEHDICGNSMRRIANGIPLPKGHGRLIDADALPLTCIDSANYGSNYIRVAPTIIEAESEE